MATVTQPSVNPESTALAELRAEVAELRSLLLGTVSAYTAGLDHLTAWAEDRYPPGPRINGLSLVASAGQQVIEDAARPVTRLFPAARS